ncbi:MAG: hypothetical protein DKM50_11135 [Candidatus Margulisiibacteriota bacterium]|nr:MAG: hypothetical protein A2X43_12355 [Candidatus Margulisbacteria bacterium GWD2_39_127]OGI03246.1 MAG: hypothetical protein A2X42_11595 [Candidatus Margulisbacteria bacterium GWF2_38_17]OGI11269.1 MAG: hypothetical protein A2X41_04020 [Candidatus Margulisbacteria bacterium GWE2_39_32]PZM78510.1 MAG: hypothetical protein DKM50_11135 [Candidatus Margulisiibacteriota bacterium]HAR63925.1 hypothetical protein [Candidatus Margulisiibacteriota bacterium]
MDYSLNVSNAFTLDIRRMMSNLKNVFEEYGIESILFLDQSAMEELYLFSQMNVTVYADIENEKLSRILKKDLKRVRPVSELDDKVDMIFLPADRSINHYDLRTERKRLRKKGLIGYKTYNFPKKGEAPLLLQQYYNRLGFMTLLSPKGKLTKVVITSHETCYYYQDKDTRLESKEVKSLVKSYGFKKELYFGELCEAYDKEVNHYAYKFYRKSKGVMTKEEMDEELMPLMTSGEISDRFNDIMEKNSLKREDFEL